MATPKKTAQPNKVTELLDLIPKLKAMPGEDEVQMADMRQAWLLHLAPSTIHERSLAEQIFTLEWEALRHRNMRDDLIRDEIRKQSMGVFHNGQVGSLGFFEQDEVAKKLGYDLVSEDPERRQKALDKLAEHEITPGEVLAKAYRAVAKDVEPHEQQISEIERRIRRLREDYLKVMATSPMPVEDAVLISSA